MATRYCAGKSLIIAAFAVALTVPGSVSGAEAQARANTPRFVTARVERGNITAVVHTVGTIRPATTMPIDVSISGTLKQIYVGPRARVHAGQILAQLDPALYETQAQAARKSLASEEATQHTLEVRLVSTQAEVANRQSNLTRLRAAADTARSEAVRVANLFQQGIVAQNQHDLTQANHQQAEAEVRAAEAQLRQFQAQLAATRSELELARVRMEAARETLRDANENLGRTPIVSPIDGVIVACNITVGQAVTAAAGPPGSFVITPDLKRMQIRAVTDAQDTAQIKSGTAVSFHLDAFPSRNYEGHVSATSLDVQTGQNSTSSETVIDFENPDERYLIGEVAYVTIPVGQALDTLKIPFAALRYTPDLAKRELGTLLARYKIPPVPNGRQSNGWNVLWKLNSARRLQPVLVKVGITDYNFAQLLEGDLKEGDVLVTGQSSVYPAVPIERTNSSARESAPPAR